MAPSDGVLMSSGYEARGRGALDRLFLRLDRYGAFQCCAGNLVIVAIFVEVVIGDVRGFCR